MLDPDAPIEPGRGLGGIAVGCDVADILATETPVRVIEIPGSDEDPDGVTIHSFDAMALRGFLVEQEQALPD